MYNPPQYDGARHEAEARHADHQSGVRHGRPAQGRRARISLLIAVCAALVGLWVVMVVADDGEERPNDFAPIVVDNSS